MNWEKLLWDSGNPQPTRIVAMCNYKDMIVVATEWNIYVLKDGKITLMDFEVQEISRK